MLHLAIELRVSLMGGYRLVATQPIAAGEVLWQDAADRQRHSSASIATWPDDEQGFFRHFSIQVDDDAFVGARQPDGVEPWQFFSHGCDPNAWWWDERTLVARRAIAAGEALTRDVATSESRPEVQVACECGSALCRGDVRGDDFLTRAELRERYGSHVMPFLRRRVGG